MAVEHFQLGAIRHAAVASDAAADFRIHRRLRAGHAIVGAGRDPLVQHLAAAVLRPDRAGGPDNEAAKYEAAKYEAAKYEAAKYEAAKNEASKYGTDRDAAGADQDTVPGAPLCWATSAIRAWYSDTKSIGSM